MKQQMMSHHNPFTDLDTPPSRDLEYKGFTIRLLPGYGLYEIVAPRDNLPSTLGGRFTKIELVKHQIDSYLEATEAAIKIDSLPEFLTVSRHRPYSPEKIKRGRPYKFQEQDKKGEEVID
jgi:hypothetical protein